MRVKHGAVLALFFGTVISLSGVAATAQAAVVTGGNALGGFSVVSSDFFTVAAEENKDDTTELFSKVEVPEGIAFANVTDALNVRSGPGTNYSRIGKLGKNAHCIIESVENGWAKITSGSVKGYCSTEYLIMGNEAVKLAESLGTLTATVNRGIVNLNVRSTPDTTADNIIAKVKGGESFKVVKEVVISKNDPEAKTFVQIEWNNDAEKNVEAYVSSEFVTVAYKYKEAVESSSYGDGVSQLRTNMIDFAMKYLGTPYVWGGNSLSRGVDCSGFVKQVFTQFGYGASMPRTSREMARTYSMISRSEAKAGDLVFYHNLRTGVVDHVAIYIGNGKIIHANNGVEISNVNYRTVYKYARVIWD
ncbi:MAG: NlpC/P60 family protein [Lachnospiraceae bacterium]|nr:NlpC/P60 family protein [Lachnospiraceae bacterium]